MRFRDLLLEYDRSKTIANFGPALLVRLKNDYEAMARFSYGLENNTEQPKDDAYMLDTALRWFELADPTPNKSLVRWIVAAYIAKRISSVEDLIRVHNVLEKIERLKASGYFRRHPDKRHLTELSKPWSLVTLESEVDLIPRAEYESEADRARRKAVLMAGEDQVDIILNTDRYKIVSPKTQDAANFYGINTKWCTTSENGEAFETYTHVSPLYIILDKPNNRRWQFHFGEHHAREDAFYDPDEYQFMDEKDRRIDTLRFGIENPEVAGALKFAMTNALKLMFNVGDPGMFIVAPKGIALDDAKYDFKLPKDLSVLGNLSIERCEYLSELPDNLTVDGHLFANYCTSLKAIPDNLHVTGSAEFAGCTSLTSIGSNLKASDVVLDRCTTLKELPDDIRARRLWCDYCPALKDEPKPKGVEFFYSYA